MKKHLFFLFLFALIFCIVFKKLILNLSTNLIDWRDYSYLTWVINQNIVHLKTFDFQNLFDLNAFYPYTNTLFLSDTLLTQSFIGLVISFFTSNPINIFNAIFIITFILNYLTTYNLFFNIFQKRIIAFAGGIGLVFSAFFYTQIGHFQMQSYWPFIIVITLLLKSHTDKSIKYDVLIGFFIALQFLASVYIAFFGLIAVFIFFLLRGVNHGQFRISGRKFSIVVLTFLILDGVFIKGYSDAKKSFNIQRSSSEYIVYAAKFSDYLFPRQNGFFYQNKLISKWNGFNKHIFGEPASFPGFVLSILAVFGLAKLSKTKKGIALLFSSQAKDLFFYALIVCGLVFSLGYPYLPLAKYVPFFDAIRGTARWSFLAYFGLTFFALKSLSKIKHNLILTLLVVLLVVDVLPQQINSVEDTYITQNDNVLSEVCTKNKTTVLEIPITHFDAGNNIAEGLSYISKRLLATSYNKCFLINGYSGYDLPSIQKLKDEVVLSFQNDDSITFYNLAKQSGASLISVNFETLPPNLYPNADSVLESLQKKGSITHIGSGVYQLH